jgi:vacuolar-type H+-ATPase subunit I/STV1
MLNLTYIFIVWELLILFGFNKKFINSIKEFNPKESGLSKSLLVILSVVSWFTILIGYLIWGVYCFWKLKSQLFGILIIGSAFISYFSRKNEFLKDKNLDALFSLIMLILILIYV